MTSAFTGLARTPFRAVKRCTAFTPRNNANARNEKPPAHLQSLTRLKTKNRFYRRRIGSGQCQQICSVQVSDPNRRNAPSRLAPIAAVSKRTVQFPGYYSLSLGRSHQQHRRVRYPERPIDAAHSHRHHTRSLPRQHLAEHPPQIHQRLQDRHECRLARRSHRYCHRHTQLAKKQPRPNLLKRSSFRPPCGSSRSNFLKTAQRTH